MIAANEVMDTRFVDSVIRLCKLQRDGLKPDHDIMAPTERCATTARWYIMMPPEACNLVTVPVRPIRQTSQATTEMTENVIRAMSAPIEG